MSKVKVCKSDHKKYYDGEQLTNASLESEVQFQTCIPLWIPVHVFTLSPFLLKCLLPLNCNLTYRRMPAGIKEKLPYGKQGSNGNLMCHENLFNAISCIIFNAK